MKIKIPIPDFSNSEITGKRTTANKKKVKSTQEDAFVELVKIISDLNITPMQVITATVSIFIIIFLYGNITSSLNTDVVGNSAANMIAIIPLLITGAMVLGLVSVMGSVLGVRGGLFGGIR